MIFQDPYASLNPRWRVAQTVAEPCWSTNFSMAAMRLTPRSLNCWGRSACARWDGQKFPHQFSGGQRQRISIARALAASPEFLVCDRPTSALDVSVQAQVLNLMRDLQQARGLTYLLISHNLAVVRHMADEIGVMYLGRMVEWADKASLFESPLHPYTRLLLDAIPKLHPRAQARQPIEGEVPNPSSHPVAAPSTRAVRWPAHAAVRKCPCCARPRRAGGWPVTRSRKAGWALERASLAQQ